MTINKALFASILLLVAPVSYSQKTSTVVDRFNYAGPYKVSSPLFETKDAQGKAFDAKSLMDAAPLKGRQTSEVPAGAAPACEGKSVGVFSFFINDLDFKKVDVEIKGAGNYKAYLDGKESPLKGLKLDPRQHRIDIKLLSDGEGKDSLFVTLKSDSEIAWSLSPKHFFGMDEVLYGEKMGNASISENGQFIIVNTSDTDRKAKSTRKTQLKEVATGKVLREKGGIFWLNGGNEYAWYETVDGNRKLWKATPGGADELVAENLPKGNIFLVPNMKFMIIAEESEGPKEDENVYQILDPDDRQPGWRDRTYMSYYDLETGSLRRLSFGSKSVYPMDISDDSRYMLVGIRNLQVQKRPSHSKATVSFPGRCSRQMPRAFWF